MRIKISQTGKELRKINMNEKELKYAGFWKRCAAQVLDFVIMGFFLYHTRYYREEYEVLLSVAATWAYFVGMESSPFRATLGKMAVGIYVTDKKRGQITFGQATGRFFGKAVSTITLFIGYLAIFWTEEQQGFHDKMAHTFVMQK